MKGQLALRDAMEPGIKAPVEFKGSLTVFFLLVCKSTLSISLANEQFSLLSNLLGRK